MRKVRPSMATAAGVKSPFAPTVKRSTMGFDELAMKSLSHYVGTRAFSVTSAGASDLRWDATGWVTRLFKLK
jgi:hypothetical protein